MIHRLNELLKERGAKKRLADMIGKPPSVISDICSGKDRLNDDLIESISAALDIEPWELFARPEELERSVLSKEEAALLKRRRALEEQEQIAFDAMTDTIIQTIKRIQK